MVSYFSLDDILTEAEVLPCTFLTDANSLGYLDDRNDDDDLAKNSRVELPIWMAIALVRWTSNQYIAIEPPHYLSSIAPFRAKLLSDPPHANLANQSLYFYQLGHKLSIMFDPELTDMLTKVLALRYQEIIRRNPSGQAHDYASFKARLSGIEDALFELKRAAYGAHMSWQQRRSGKLTASSSLAMVRRSSSSRSFITSPSSSSSSSSSSSAVGSSPSSRKRKDHPVDEPNMAART